MSRKKGLSREEKLDRMLDLFRESVIPKIFRGINNIFIFFFFLFPFHSNIYLNSLLCLQKKKAVLTLKDLEKRAFKEKGIVKQTVKEIALELVYDGKIFMEKVGTSNYFWSFPSHYLKMRTTKIEELTETINKNKRKREDLEKRKEELLETRNPTEERESKLLKLEQLKEENEKYREELTQFAQNDPELLEAYMKDIQLAKEGVNRWTDNTYTIRSYMENKFSMTREIADQQLGIGEDFDYVE